MHRWGTYPFTFLGLVAASGLRWRGRIFIRKPVTDHSLNVRYEKCGNDWLGVETRFCRRIQSQVVRLCKLLTLTHVSEYGKLSTDENPVTSGPQRVEAQKSYVQERLKTPPNSQNLSVAPKQQLAACRASSKPVGELAMQKALILA